MVLLLTVLITLFTALIQSPEDGSIAFQILEQETGEPLPAATVYIEELERGTTADGDGYAAFKDLPEGTYTFTFRFLGFEEATRSFDIPYTGTQPVQILLEHEHGHLEEITVSTTRTTRTIEDAPTRVKAITLEEIQEKGNMRPGDIRMLLAESTGIQVQQTSAISGSSNFRIQGLDGRYTQLLKDGFPLYSGFSGGLSIMQIPPLDLYQVELVKGANSTLYGGGAIAGLVNLITKQPRDEREISVLANLSTSNSRDMSAFYSERFRSVGVTLFSAWNQSSGYDPSDQGFSAVPEYNRFTLNPRLIWTPSADTKLMAGGQLSLEDRLGGDMDYLNGEVQSGRYFEEHNSSRLSTQASLDHRFSDNTRLTAKNSFTFFDRSIEVPGFLFEGNQTASFSEIAVLHENGWGSWVGGLNLWTDRFDEQGTTQAEARSVDKVTFGSFLQNTANFSDQLSMETGMRVDYTPDVRNGWYVLPRIAALYRFNTQWSMRVGGGLGYKLPDMFTDEAENRAFENVLPPDLDEVRAERSYGLNLDVNYRAIIADKIVFRVNQLAYYTRLNDPLILEQGNDSLFRFANLNGHVRSRGTETNIAFIYDHIKLFFGYTYVDAVRDRDGSSSSVQLPLNSPHQGSGVLMIEEHGSYRLGLESYYYSSQKLNDGSTGQAYTIFGIMGEKTWGMFTVFANFENMFDTRQTRFGPIFTGTRAQPAFQDIFAPLEGRYVNLGIKIGI